MDQESKCSTITIVFEVCDDDKDRFEDTKTVADSLHEALCQCIHEQNEGALKWLAENISDIVPPNAK